MGPLLVIALGCLTVACSWQRALKSYAFTAWVLTFVAASMVCPKAFGVWYGFDLKFLSVPLIQIIMFGMGTTLSLADFSRVLAMPWAVGTTVTCACSGCGIVYNHQTKKYHILCCGTIFEMDAKNQADDPTNPPKRNHIMVDFAGLTLLEPAQLLDRAAPGKISVNASLQRLRKRITIKANKPLVTLTKKLRLHSTSK